VAEAARGGAGLLSRLGAEVVAVTLPELEQLRVAHTVTFMMEALRTRHVAEAWATQEQRSQVGGRGALGRNPMAARSASFSVVRRFFPLLLAQADSPPVVRLFFVTRYIELS
jgi:hypothetical protein